MVLQMAVTLQSRALLCLNNLIEIMNVDELGGCQALFEVWKNLATLSFSSDKDQVFKKTHEISLISLIYIFLKIILSKNRSLKQQLLPCVRLHKNYAQPKLLN